MDLEVLGRHALLFDDDAMAAFVNSPNALVEWNGLSIDRYDVRHLLSAPPPPRRRHSDSADASLESQLDLERYLDLPPPLPPPSDQQDLENNESERNSAGGYHAVSFSYGNLGEPTVQENSHTESDFRPPFPVPEHLLQHLPPTEKAHQIISRTAMFVRKHGGQSEIVLRVKQGDNPTFGFLLPDNDLHPYYRFLVDNQEVLKSALEGKSSDEGRKDGSGLEQMGSVGGALSLLGSVYGSGEDEEGEVGDSQATEREGSEEAVKTDTKNKSSSASQQTISAADLVDKEDSTSKKAVPLVKERAHVIKRNSSISRISAGATTGLKREADSSGSSAVDRSLTPARASLSNLEIFILEPPSDMKRTVDKIVEFILRNGREFEAVLAQQDTKHGRFPFLLPSNQYHPYYLKVLHNAQQLKLAGKVFSSERHDSEDHGAQRKSASKESDTQALASDIPWDSDKKEKFKMVIGKSKKDGPDPPSKPPAPPQVTVTVDAAAAAAILQAATKGIKNPSLDILSKLSVSGSSQGHSSDGGDPTGAAVPVTKVIAESAAIASVNEADSSETSLTREQKLKAERLKRAKMFAAMLKSGAASSKSERLRAFSVEPAVSGISGLSAGQEREDSSVPADTSDKLDKVEKKESSNGFSERISKRSYRSRHKQEEELEQEEEGDDGVDEDGDKHSKKKRRSHHFSHRSRDKHKHRKRHSSSKHRHKHDTDSDGEQQHSRYRNKEDGSSEEDEHKHSRHRHRHCEHDGSSSDDKNRRSSHRRKHNLPSDDEHRPSRRRRKHERSSRSERETDLEEGEILAKSDQSKTSQGASREASVDVSKSEQNAATQGPDMSDVPDELRAKIRAMLMATL